MVKNVKNKIQGNDKKKHLTIIPPLMNIAFMKLNYFLKKSKITYVELAEVLDVSLATVYRYAHDERIPHKHIMQKLVKFTGGQVTANDFY